MKTQLEFWIEEVESRLRRLYELTIKAFRDAMKAFETLDIEQADTVKDMGDDIDEMVEKVEQNIFETIARRQPVASDLRKLSTYLQVSHHLARVGRYAYKVAHIVKLCEGMEHYKELESLPYLAELANNTLDIAMKAVFEEDLTEVPELEKMESESDRETSEMFEEIAQYLRKRSDISQMSMFYVIVGRYCERAADHAFQIAERAYYMVTGERKKLGLAYKGLADEAPH